jgi:starvation-inducible DNA-binding protein
MASEVGAEAKAMPINNGIGENERREITESLGRLLADTYTLYLKTHGFHWNVTGPMFYMLHKMFEEQYRELGDAVDRLAERIRALGFQAPCTYREFTQLTSIREEQGVPTAEEMIRSLVEGHEMIIRTARATLTVAEGHNDQATVDLMNDRLEVHEENSWMLRSHLTRGAARAA